MARDAGMTGEETEESANASVSESAGDNIDPGDLGCDTVIMTPTAMLLITMVHLQNKQYKIYPFQKEHYEYLTGPSS